jgi:hypothetical protein
MQWIQLEKWAAHFICTLSLAAVLSPGLAQPTGTNPEIYQKVAVLKQSVANNQKALREYTWVETMQTIYKGDTKSTKQSLCQYGADGTVQKTAMGPAQPPPSNPRGLKGRVVEKKKDELQDYMERVASLIKRYTPPDGSAMQNSLQSGKASILPSGSGIVAIAFHDYAKPEDTVTVTFDTSTKKIRDYDVNTYLDAPADVVTLKVVFDATAKQVQIRTTSSDFNKL